MPRGQRRFSKNLRAAFSSENFATVSTKDSSERVFIVGIFHGLEHLSSGKLNICKEFIMSFLLGVIKGFMDLKDAESAKVDRFFAIPASGVVFASGGAMIGTAIGGPIGSLVGAGVGALSGVFVEISSQRRHAKEKNG